MIRHRFARCGFSVIELMVVLGILLVLVSIFVPYELKAWEVEHRAKCADNLRALAVALGNYAGDSRNAGDYPRVIYDPVVNPHGYTCYTGVDAGNPFAADSGVRPGDVTASLWLLVRLNLADPARFICPSTDDVADPIDSAAGGRVSVDQRGNFRGPRSLSYSYACPFSSAPGYRLNDTRRSGFVLMADKNPGSVGLAGESDPTSVPSTATKLKLAPANSDNHGKAGQNVLYNDGHVFFQDTPYCGVDRDNIYTAQAPLPLQANQTVAADVNGFLGHGIGPATASDTYLVPTATDDVPPPLVVATTLPVAAATTMPIQVQPVILPASQPAKAIATTVPTTVFTTQPATKP